MSLRIRRVFCSGSICLVILFTGAVARAAGDDGGQYFYSYFHEPMPLTLDPECVAIQTAGGRDLTELVGPLAGFGMDAATLEPRAVPGWAHVKTPANARGDQSIAALVASMADTIDFAFVSPVFLDDRGQPMVITPDLLIGFEDGVSVASAEAVIAEHVPGAVIEHHFGGLPDIYRVRTTLKNGFDVLDLVNSLVSVPGVAFAESDAIVRLEPSLIPNDPLFPQQWGLNQGNDQDMDCPEAWDLTTGDPSIVVVIMDLGIQQNHPDIHQIPGQDFTGNNTPGGGPYNECDEHGTCVAGCVSATINNSTGVVGVAPNCVSRSAKIGTGIEFLGFCLPFIDAQPSYIVNALNWALSTGARVTNSSFGMSADAALTTAYNNTRAAGLIHFAATGNDGSASISYPASIASVNAVGALSSNGNRASFSQYGTGIDFSAPGEGILTTDRTGSSGYESGDYATLDGTSFASPNAAGVAALVISRDPSLTASEVEQIMRDTCVDKGAAGYDTTYGWGAVNAYNAVLAAGPVCALLGDVNQSGVIDGEDVAGFVRAKTGQPAAPGENQACADYGGSLTQDINDFITDLLS